MIRRPPRSTQSRSSAASDVYKRQIEKEELRQHLPHQARHDITIGPQVVQRGESEPPIPRSRDEARHALGRPDDRTPDRFNGARRKSTEGAQNERDLSEKFLVSRVRRPTGCRPFPREPRRFSGRGIAEQADEVAKRADSRLWRKVRRVLERVRDPEQKIGYRDLPAGRLRQRRDREGERATCLLEEIEEVGHAQGRLAGSAPES